MTILVIIGIGAAWAMGEMDMLSVALFGGPLVCFSLMVDGMMGQFTDDDEHDPVQKARENQQKQREGMMMLVAKEIQKIVDRSR